MEETIDTSGIARRPSYLRKWSSFVLGRKRTTVANFTDRLAEVYGDRTAILLDHPIRTDYFTGQVISYRDLSRMARRAANALHALGVRRGDRVALATLNRIEMAFVEFGAQRLGAVPVPLNFMLTVDEIRELVERSGAKVLVLDRTVFERNVRDVAALPSVESWVMVTSKETPDGIDSLDDLMSAASEAHEPADLSEDDPAIIFFTAGTTGFPKGATLTNGGLMYSFRRYAAIAAVRPTQTDSLALAVMPLAHTGGHQLLLIQLALAVPALLVGTFDPEKILDYIERYRVTMFSGITTMYRMLLDAGAEQRDLSSVRMWGAGGEPTPSDLLERFRSLSQQRTGPFRRKAAFVTGYGLAETAGQVSIAPSFAASDGCVGWFMPGVQWRLVDEEGRPVERGEVGELVLKTPGLMREYWGDDEATSAAIRDGWFHTGDLMRRGRWGLKYFVAREKEMIKVGGYSVFPAEVERAVEAHPAVEQCCVVGLPHSQKGELPVAAVVCDPDAKVAEDELMAWMEKHIAAYRCPRQVVFVDEIAVSFAMKPLRRTVRGQLLARGVTVQSRSQRGRRAVSA